MKRGMISLVLVCLIAGAMGCAYQPEQAEEGPTRPEQINENTPRSESQGPDSVSLEEAGIPEPVQLGLLNEQGMTVEERFGVPRGYERAAAQASSFGHYLRNLRLKPHGAKVLYYNGEEKFRDVYEAVVDMDIGNRDLQQCADAVMRLRAEYLYGQEQFDKIHFNFTSGFRADYAKWMQGNRIVVQGNDVRWKAQGGYSQDYQSFRNYLDMVFAYAGTLSLSKELDTVDVLEMKIGDVFIQGGSPGHCVIVVDMAVNGETGEKLFMLAQSYMPAQDIQILKNPGDRDISPWYPLNFEGSLITPEWVFGKGDLKRFVE